MSIIEKIKSKLNSKKEVYDVNRLNLHEFRDKENGKKAHKMLKQIERDMANIRLSDFYYKYKDEVYNDTTNLINSIKDFTNNALYSESIAFLTESARLYAIYYLNADESRTQKAINLVSDRLIDVYDLITFTTLKHFNYERTEPLVFIGTKFYCKNNKNGSPLVTFIATKLRTISDLVSSIRDKNNNNVFFDNQTLAESEIIQITDAPFQEFE